VVEVRTGPQGLVVALVTRQLGLHVVRGFVSGGPHAGSAMALDALCGCSLQHTVDVAGTTRHPSVGAEQRESGEQVVEILAGSPNSNGMRSVTRGRRQIDLRVVHLQAIGERQVAPEGRKRHGEQESANQRAPEPDWNCRLAGRRPDHECLIHYHVSVLMAPTMANCEWC
jgi:hypothetical protein